MRVSYSDKKDKQIFSWKVKICPGFLFEKTVLTEKDLKMIKLILAIALGREKKDMEAYITERIKALELL